LESTSKHLELFKSKREQKRRHSFWKLENWLKSHTGTGNEEDETELEKLTVTPSAELLTRHGMRALLLTCAVIVRFPERNELFSGGDSKESSVIPG